MSNTIVRYVSRLLAVHLGLLLLAAIALLLLLDMLNSADEVTARHGGRLSALLTYAALRLPQIVNMMLPFTMLLAALLCLARLARANEIVALKAGGFSFYKLLLAFAPLAMLVGALYFAINDQLLPWSTKTLAAWNAAPDQPVANAEPVWLRDGSVLVGVEGVADEGRELNGVRVFERGGKGILTEMTTARRAVHRDGAWAFEESWRYEIASGQDAEAVFAAELPWTTSLTPAHFANLATDPATLSFRELLQFILKPNVGARSVHFYQTWLQHKITLPITLLVMLLLAAPVAQRLNRQGGMAAGLAIGVGLGFLYFVCEGLMLTLGETGALSPLIAAWAPPLLFGAFGTFWLLRVEGY
jgi:lipopolysaccharide export system permease protein